MLKHIVTGLLYCFLAAAIGYAGEEEWTKVSRQYSGVRCAAIHPDAPQVLLMGAGNTVLSSGDGGESWSAALIVRGEAAVINAVIFDPRDAQKIYACSSAGLYYSGSKGKHWNRVFKGRNRMQADALSIGIAGDTIYLGTSDGLFISHDEGRSWRKAAVGSGSLQVYSIACDARRPLAAYIASSSGVFKSEDKGNSWRQTFFSPCVAEEEAEEQEEGEIEEPQRAGAGFICFDQQDQHIFYLGTSRGIYRSKDNAETWERFENSGLLQPQVRFILSFPASVLYAMTARGIFVFKDDRWHEVSFRLYATQLYSLTSDKQGVLYAAAREGLFKRQAVSLQNITLCDDPLDPYSKGEPSIGLVQEAAIRYAEVSPEKIKRWRRDAARKAWLPEVTFGIDRDTSDLWHWEGGSTTRADDDCLVRGRDSIAWDVSLSWDLGELIWNDDQTSIDVRSRLMVELRQEILDEVTKVYFERLRTKMDIDHLSIEERAKRMEKEIKIRELTAMLDALTGGFFSQNIHNEKSQIPSTKFQ
ncbi:MAG: hypothetical protein PHR11_04815 [Candidatus Omnitrophica bacterium]|nr:hypothetical protein [Candidatus Omnitrophota bacterium]